MRNPQTAQVLQFKARETSPVKADLADGYTTIANSLWDYMPRAGLSHREWVILNGIIRKTYGFKRKTDRISDGQLAEWSGIARQHVNEAKNSLIRRRIVIKSGREIGPNPFLSEWLIPDKSVTKSVTNLKGKCHQIGDKSVTKSVTKNTDSEACSSRESVTDSVTKVSPNRDTQKKKERNTVNTPPLPPTGESAVADGGDRETKILSLETAPAKPTHNHIDYQAVADAYNSTLGDRLPKCKGLNDKRKRAIKILLGNLAEPTPEHAARYFRSFAKKAREFYFGDNNRGWQANFDYLLRIDTLTKTREGAL